ncbi:MAG: hypothetical protein JWM38_835 [Sphingomonas bacterium]|jgi:hypothetical protein|nr:hypothetical protein [Sphingomonas bacterium]MDB5717408.1 hypothetical protein [Sphingomonas bacterium]
MSLRKSMAAGVLLLMAVAGTADAHHSFAMFDQTKKVSLVGTIVEFQWTNPHAWIEIMVPDEAGKPVRWSVELNSPNNLSRQGFKRSSLKPGDKATVVINPLRNGKKGGLFNAVTLPNGTVLGEKAITGKPINVPGA